MFPERQLPRFVNEVADGRPSWPVLGTPVISRRDDFQQYRSDVLNFNNDVFIFTVTFYFCFSIRSRDVGFYFKMNLLL